MASKNEELGRQVAAHLESAGVESPISKTNRLNTTQMKTELAHSQFAIMSNLGLDLNHPSLSGTPQRVAKMYVDEVFYGLDYTNFPACTTQPNDMKSNELVMLNGIPVKSMCEHHFVPFIGTAAIGYIPGNKLLGLSKFNRIVDFFCRRPQVQERLTRQISTALSYILDCWDVAVVIKAEHLCTSLRGVEHPHTDTTTSSMTGKFMSVPELRAEFLQLLR